MRAVRSAVEAACVGAVTTFAGLFFTTGVDGVVDGLDRFMFGGGGS